MAQAWGQGDKNGCGASRGLGQQSGYTVGGGLKGEGGGQKVQMCKRCFKALGY